MKKRGRGGRERDEAENNGGNEKMTPRERRKLGKESWNGEDGENEGMTGGGQKHGGDRVGGKRRMEEQTQEVG